MNWPIVWTLVVKDLRLYFRNQFFAFISILGLVAYIGIYYLLPGNVNETIKIGLYASQAPPLFEEMEEEGLELIRYDSEEALEQGLMDGDVAVGYGLPEDLMGSLATGSKEQIKVYFTYDFPEDLKDAYVILFRELAFMMTGQELNIEADEVILGQDMAGMQIPPRSRMVPLLAVFVLMIETLGLASLISSEIEEGTLTALFVTPMRAVELFAGKGITGTGMAFIQAFVLIAATGGLSHEPLLVMLALVLGALLSTGVAFLIASGSRDIMTVMGWGILAIVTLSLPSIGVLFPGVFTSWIKAIPSYYLVDLMHKVINFGAGWGDVWVNLPILFGFSLAFMVLGILALQRRYR